MKRICVDCGSSSGSGDAYKDMAKQLGKALAANDIELVYGGANIGLMGRVADSVLENNGNAIGVVPTFLPAIWVTEIRRNCISSTPCTKEKR